MNHPPFARLALVLAALPLPLAGCGSHEGRQVYQERLPRLETVTPTRSVLPVHIELTASLEPIDRADLMARSPGVVAYLPRDVDLGRRVTAGEELIRLGVPDLEADKKYKQAMLDQSRKQEVLARKARLVAVKELSEAREQVARYQSDHDFRFDQHERILKLVKGSAVSPERQEETLNQLKASKSAWQASVAQVETREAKLDALDADIDVALSRIKVAEAEVERVNALLSFAVIRAPFDGVITKRWVSLGDTIKDAGAPLLTVVAIDTIRVLIDIPARDVPLIKDSMDRVWQARSRVQVGVVAALPGLGPLAALSWFHLKLDEHFENYEGPAEVELTVLGLPGEKFRAPLTALASSLDMNTRTMRVELFLRNTQGHLSPGMFGTATVVLPERKHKEVLTIPSTALVRQGERTEVAYVEGAQGDPPTGTVRRVEVVLGRDNGKRVEVRSGLKGTERIIVRGNGMIRSGDKVIAVPLEEAREP